MTPKDFAIGLMRGVVDENVATYRELFTHTVATQASDPYWQRVLSLFSSLDRDQRAVFFEIVRQVSVDSVSNTLGVLDGVNGIEGVDSGLTLLDATGLKQNGDLQSLFLVEDEGKAR